MDIPDFLDPVLDRDSILLIKGPMSSKSMIEFANSLKVDNNIKRSIQPFMDECFFLYLI